MSQSFVIQFRLGPLETALIDFYGDTYAKSRADVVRTMITRYVSGDRSFDADAFQRFVSRKAARKITDPETKRELLRAAKDYVASRKSQGRSRQGR